MLMWHIIFECRATQMWFPLQAVTVWTCPIFACVLCFLPGGGKDKGRLWWWEQEGKTTVSQNCRVLNKHHRRRIWATQSKDNVPAIICVFHRSSHFLTLLHMCASAREQTAASPQLRTFVTVTVIFRSNPSYGPVYSGHLHLLHPVQPAFLSGLL